MFVLCPNCGNHYDDSCESKVCSWAPGKPVEVDHRRLARSPVQEHVLNTVRARAAHALGGRPKRRTPSQRPPVAP